MDGAALALTRVWKERFARRAVGVAEPEFSTGASRRPTSPGVTLVDRSLSFASSFWTRRSVVFCAAFSRASEGPWPGRGVEKAN